jgi:hypothetical protein
VLADVFPAHCAGGLLAGEGLLRRIVSVAGHTGCPGQSAEVTGQVAGVDHVEFGLSCQGGFQLVRSIVMRRPPPGIGVQHAQRRPFEGRGVLIGGLDPVLQASLR